MRGRRFDAHARQVRSDAREQHRVVHAAAADEHAARVRLVRAQRIGDGARGEFEQRGLHVFGASPPRTCVRTQSRWKCSRPLLFGGGSANQGSCEQAFEQGVVDAAAGGEGAVRVERRAAVLFAPCVHQCVRGAGVEAAHVALRGQQGEVGDAAEVEHGARLRSHRAAARRGRRAPAARPGRRRRRRGGGSRRRCRCRVRSAMTLRVAESAR